MSALDEQLTEAKSLLIGNYARMNYIMTRGEGSRLWDSQGRQYIDLFAGFGGAILGHCHPDLIKAANEQANTLWHVGNTFYTQPQINVAKWLNKTAYTGKAFFCHSGLEANEAACKLARLAGKPNGKWKIISFNRSFHGRSLAMIAATGNPKTRMGFEPVVPGFIQVAPGDIAALAAAVDDETAGIIMEPIQGEGGIHHYPAEYPAQVRKLCDEKKLALIFDEVWTGCGRTGKWFGHQYFANITPDIMTLAKAVGGGLPVGVMFAKPAFADLMVPGTHGCTLGANPICMAVASKIFEIIHRDNLLDNALQLGALAVDRLSSSAALKGKIKEVRGKGLMLGIELAEPPQGNIVDKGLANGVLLNLTAGNVIRLAPPINIDRELFIQGLDRVIQTLSQ